MEAVAHNPAFAKKAGVPQSVGKDFSAADKGRKFQKGGATMMGKKIPGVMADMMARRRPRMGAGMPPPAPPVMPPQPPAPMGMKKGGMHKMPDGKMMKNSDMKMRGMKEGGMAMVEKDGKMVPDFAADGKGKMSMGGMAKGTNMNPKGSTSGSSRAGENTKIQKKGLTEGRVIKMAAGGSVSSASRRADGIAQRGKTRG